MQRVEDLNVQYLSDHFLVCSSTNDIVYLEVAPVALCF